MRRKQICHVTGGVFNEALTKLGLDGNVSYYRVSLKKRNPLKFVKYADLVRDSVKMIAATKSTIILGT